MKRITLTRLVLVVTLARFAYLLWLCPYALVEDEAHYWEWSRRLGWSYYSKGPGIAWLIALATRILGDTTGAVRIPAAISSGVAAWAVGTLASRAGPDRRAPVLAAAIFLLLPAFQITALIMTIDGPFLACWALACLAAWDALESGRRRCWAMLGFWLALGFLFKYTILLLVPGLVIGAWLTRRARSRRLGAGPAIALAIALLGLVPVLVWNAQRGWPTVHHLLGHLGLRAGDQPATPRPYSPLQTLEFIGTQLGVLGPAAGLLILASIRAGRSRAAAPRFMLSASAPILIFYLGVTFVADAEANWALGGYVALASLAGVVLAERSEMPVPRRLWRATWIAGILVAALGLRADLLARVPGVGRWIPAGRFMAASVMARDADRRVAELRLRSDAEPIVIASEYGRASQLAFHMKGHPIVYCASGWGGAGRRTQYSYWPDTDLGDPTLFGRSALLVGGEPERWATAFDRVEDAGRLDGESKKGRRVYIGVGYRGFSTR